MKVQHVKVGYWLQLSAGFLIAAGALGHTLGRGPELAIELGRSGLVSPTQQLVLVVWWFAGGCMALLGLRLILDVGEARGGHLLPWLALFYAGFGLAAVAWSRQAFFWIFFALGAASFVAWLLRRGEPR